MVSKQALALFVVVMTTTIAGIGFLLLRFQPHPVVVSAPQPLPKAPFLDYYVELTQDGKPTSPGRLIALFTRNPNRFALATSKSTFVVEGRIEQVSKSNEVLDEISGFYIPLQMTALPKGIDKGPDSLSLFVKKLTRREIADFNPGNLVQAKCPKVRVVNSSLVFDDCTLV